MPITDGHLIGLDWIGLDWIGPIVTNLII